MKNDLTIDDMRAMDLHDELRVNSCYVMRVPGGWIYSQYVYAGVSCEKKRMDRVVATFVPES